MSMLQALALEKSSKYAEEYEGLARIDEAVKEDSKMNTIVEFEYLSSKYSSRRGSLNGIVVHTPGSGGGVMASKFGGS